jgi:glycosyltransferase involved in cell wall biosynthesis
MGENRILVIISLMQGQPWGGSEELWFRSALYGLKNHIKIYVFIKKWSKEHKNITRLRKLGAHVFYLPESSKSKINFFQKVFQKKNSFDENFSRIHLMDPDMILVNQGDTFSAFGSPIFHQIMNSNKPVCLLSQHLSDNEVISDILKTRANEYLVSINKFCFVSNRSLELTKELLSSDGTNFHLVNNPVKLKDKNVVKFPNNDIPSFGVVARLDCQYKGQDILLKVLSKDKWKLRSWKCNLYGNGKDKDYLKNLISDYGLEGKVNLKGYCESVEKIWSENHIMILPSLSEGTPLSLVEAQLCGRAAIATDVGGVSEVLIDGITGWLAASPSIIDIDVAMERAWEDKDNWRKIGLESNKTTIRRYCKDAGQELLDLILNK